MSKRNHINAPKNFNPCSSDLATLVDTAVKNNLLPENSVMYALLINTITSLQLQEKEQQEFKRNKIWTAT